MTRTVPALLLTALLPFLAGCGSSDPDAPAASGIPASDIGLARGEIESTLVPDPVPFNTSGPAERPLPARAYPGAPPVIPHDIADFVPLTRESNLCLDCHLVDEKEVGSPTPLPPDHYVDLRNAPEEARETVAGARYNCLACHAPQTDAAPLVASGSRGDAVTRE